MKSLSLGLLIIALFCTLLIAQATEDKSHLCAIADYDYNLEETDEGYIFHFTDLTKGAFIAYVDVNWSTIVPHPTDKTGSKVPSPIETLRLKRTSRAEFGALIPNEVLAHSLYETSTDGETPLPSTVLDKCLEDNQVNLRFTFSFWLISPDGTEDVVCESPFMVV